MKKSLSQILCLWSVLLFVLNIFAQTPTIGLRFYNEDVTDGYTLFTPINNFHVYLINNCGEKVNEWIFTEKPGATCYLLENGNLLRAGNEMIEIRDWDNTIIWSYSLAAIGINQHHDIEILPNGNVLCLITDDYTDQEMIAQGKDPSTVGATLKLDKVIELQPVGLNDANIVWEWKFIDHFIQDYDNTKPNYGNVLLHPELIDLNYNAPNVSNQLDYTHVNAIDYNASLDHILMSARHLNEIYIIDHSTTTAEATSHSGGNYGLGGDILWRWGNPHVYKQGDVTDQKLFLQHDSKWVEDGYLDEGKISVFNNGGDVTNNFSSIHLITPEIINNEYTKDTNKFKPLDYEWSWNGSILGETVLERSRSGAHSLPNGNFIICETSHGQISEISKTGTPLWTYKNPTEVDANIFNQFDVVTSANSLFRGEKYPSNYIGFVGKDLTSQGIIENQNSVSQACIDALSLTELELNALVIINPIKYGLLEFNQTLNLDELSIFDLNGKSVFTLKNFQGKATGINLESSIYIIKLQKGSEIEYQKIIVQ